MSNGLKKWQLLSQERESSGLSQKAFCASKDLNYSTFSNWRSELIKKGLVSSSVYLKQVSSDDNFASFVPLSFPTRQGKDNDAVPMIEIQLPSGVVIKVPVDAGTE